MSLMLSAGSPTARSLTEIAPGVLQSLHGTGEWLPPAASAITVVIDGLGAGALRANSGHARRLASAMTRRDVARSVFPSTTAAAYTSLLTGAWPGEHGMPGYTLRVPLSGRIANQLSGFRDTDMAPSTWQRATTMFERQRAAGGRAFAVGKADYAASDLTAAHLRGATYVAENDVRQRLRVALSLAAESGTVVNCYFAELDQAGHRFGRESPQWLAALEQIDAAFEAPIPGGIGVLVTSDHGMVNVPVERKVVIAADDERWHDVSAVAGEPRMLHLYAERADATRGIVDRWKAASGDAAIVLARAEAVQEQLFGPDGLAAEVEPRVGDVLVIARSTWAFYDGRDRSSQGLSMVGQHGALTEDEVLVPLIRLGAYSRSG